MQYFAVIWFFLGYVPLDEFHLGAVLDANAVSEFEDLVGAIAAITGVVPVFESEGVLGCFGEEED